MKFSFSKFFWDCVCAGSVIGIWPRFIEPKLLKITRLELAFPNLPVDFKIVHLSDLHASSYYSDKQWQRLIRKVNGEKPDLIVFTGDFICCGRMQKTPRLKHFLTSLKAPLGCFAVLGNHDYNGYVTINRAGDYDIAEKEPSQFCKGFERLLTSTKITKRVTPRAQELPWNDDLVSLLSDCGITLLHNETRQISISNAKIGIVGLGEHMLGRANPSDAFKNHQDGHFNLVLVHNPDAIDKLLPYPADLILSGHTHGGQINLPLLWKKFTLMENQNYKQGLFHTQGKKIYVSRGLGSVIPFRFFAPPEIVSITVRGKA